jgi:hypothetical protein
MEFEHMLDGTKVDARHENWSGRGFDFFSFLFSFFSQRAQEYPDTGEEGGMMHA